MKNITLTFLFCLLFVVPIQAQDYAQLMELKGYSMPVYISKGQEEAGREIAALCDRAKIYMEERVAGFSPKVTLLILSPDDWPGFANMPVIYGMPHNSRNNTLVVAAKDNPFWQSQMPPAEIVPAELREAYTETYTTDEGILSGKAFFNLLAIHELGHAFRLQGNLSKPRFWLDELFCNMIKHTIIAEIAPELLPANDLLPEIVVGFGSAKYAYTTLEQFEASYEIIARTAPQNYGWYQLGFDVAAKKIYDAGGLKALQSIWNALKNSQEVMSDEELLSMLRGKTHPKVAEMVENWNN
ncbi:MAG TPA: hypothetical protein PKC24_01925 [Cyclobacteriaceae bacterium]|nr:hypothetical protein [Cyclobacteriaceae bacterium]